MSCRVKLRLMPDFFHGGCWVGSRKRLGARHRKEKYDSGLAISWRFTITPLRLPQLGLFHTVVDPLYCALLTKHTISPF